MPTEAPLPKGDPRIIAWEAYQLTDDFRNMKRWATDPAHTQGSMWAAFLAGFEAALKAQGQQPC